MYAIQPGVSLKLMSTLFKNILLLSAAALISAAVAFGVSSLTMGKGSAPSAPAVPAEPAIPPAPPTAFRAEELQRSFAAVARKAMPSVVLITARKRVGVLSGSPWNYSRRIDYYDLPAGQGSGFFISPEGLILTNYHVVKDQDTFWITTHDGTEFSATVVGADPPTDLALLRIDGNPDRKFEALTFADPDTVEIGHWAIAIGAPFSLSRTVTAGIVSSKQRSGVGVNLYENYIQTDASINPGNSGGPLLNLAGEVIGINDFILSPSGGNIGLSFAISSEIAGKVADQLAADGHVDRPWFGVIFREFSRAERKRLGVKRGVLVEQVFRNSPAAAAGIRRGDFITAAGDREINTVHDLRNRIFAAEPGERIPVEINRDGNLRKLKVRLDPAPRGYYRQNAGAAGEGRGFVEFPGVL